MAAWGDAGWTSPPRLTLGGRPRRGFGGHPLSQANAGATGMLFAKPLRPRPITGIPRSMYRWTVFRLTPKKSANALGRICGGKSAGGAEFAIVNPFAWGRHSYSARYRRPARDFVIRARDGQCLLCRRLRHSHRRHSGGSALRQAVGGFGPISVPFYTEIFVFRCRRVSPPVSGLC